MQNVLVSSQTASAKLSSFTDEIVDFDIEDGISLINEDDSSVIVGRSYSYHKYTRFCF